ncbi:unnamed protein product, partial [Meganyctiphanes norvegica]
MNVEYFPFDIQICKMKWASWTYDGHHLDLRQQTDTGDMSNYQVNGEFDLQQFRAVRNVEQYSCCPEPYPDITFHITIRRRPMFYVFNLILPCVLINCIALLVFYVPSESGEKVTLGISSVLSMTVFLMTIRESLPPTEKTPLISLYYGVTICLVSFASGLSVLTLNIHHRGIRGIEVPSFLKKLILGWVAKMVFLHFEDPPIPTEEKNVKLNVFHKVRILVFHKVFHKVRILVSLLLEPPIPTEEKNVKLNRRRMLNSMTSIITPTIYTSPQDSEQQFLRVLNKVYNTIEKNEMRLGEQDRREATRVEWQQVALVCDRFLLACFVMATCIATFSILFSSPH